MSDDPPRLRDLLGELDGRTVRLDADELTTDPAGLDGGVPFELGAAVAALANTEGGQVLLDLAPATSPAAAHLDLAAVHAGVRRDLGDEVADACEVTDRDEGLRITVAPASRPVLPARGADGRRRFLIRVNGATRELTDAEAAEYRRQRWPPVAPA